MRRIQELIDLIDEELEGSKLYAEKYLDFKSKNDTTWSAKFKQMSTDELNHSGIIHDLAVKEIEELNHVFSAPVEMERAWELAHKEYIERAAWVKQMLSM